MAPDPGSRKPVRPLMSRLGANNKSLYSPNAPKLAANASPSSTPPSKRPLSTITTSTHKTKSAVDLSTPLQASISPNVTPRSASRRSRAGSAQSTLSKTSDIITSGAKPPPVFKLASPKVDEGNFSKSGLGDGSKATFTDRKRAVANSVVPNESRPLRSLQTTTSRLMLREPETDAPAQTHFFFASDAPSQIAEPKPVQQKKATTFFYANGEQELPSTVTKPPSVVESLGSPSSDFGGVFGTGSARLTTASPDTLPHTLPFSFQSKSPTIFRAPSPPKDSFHLSYRKGASQIIRPNPATPLSPTVLSDRSDNVQQEPKRRLSSLDLDADQRSKPKSYSISSASSRVPFTAIRADDRVPVFPPTSPGSIVDGSFPTSPTRSPGHPLSRAEVIDCGTSNPSDDVLSPSNGQSGDSTLKQFSDLAANARHERKLLDLEISNSSLMAINKSLEREVRKQKIELRRFRRLSRATTSRTSWLSDVSSISSVGGLGILNEGDIGLLPDLLEEEEDYDLDDESDLDSIDEDTMSPAALAISDAKYLESDARRLRLDLARHKELLIDSQKMNQSIKRCLGWTEQLIKDGNKALQYQVRIGDLEFGGRVLSPDEVEDYDDSEQTSKGFFDKRWKPSEPNKNDRSAGSDITDRDSGVDLEFNQSLS